MEPEVVVVARREDAGYHSPDLAETAPELPGGRANGAPEVLLRRLLANAGLDSAHYGRDAWNPLSDLIRRGDKVVIKPNWVHHKNGSGQGLECLVTHSTVIAAILKYVIPTRPSQIIIGDAPIQGCDFQALCQQAGVHELLARYNGEVRIAVRDFRLRMRKGEGFAAQSIGSERGRDQYVEYDLGASSWLEPITRGQTEFRVTMYDPDALKKSHSRAIHRYLVAREIVDADVVISVPKLKTHNKACLTGALKNVVGINGLKDYLPHHRKGGSGRGGDCYAGNSTLKRLAETCTDAGNRSQMRWLRALLGDAGKVSVRLDGLCGGDRNLEGSWYGNDTIWRTVLDLRTILSFGRLDGTIAPSPQRRVIHITDAIVAGEGEGPLYPTPVPLGVMTMASDASAAECVHALMMGFDPEKIPLIRNALLGSAVGGDVSRIRVCRDGKLLTCEQFRQNEWRRFQPPAGWADHCELADPCERLEPQPC